MKKISCVFAAVVAVIGLAACLNPIGFDENMRFGVDANVEGELSIVSPDVVLYVHNHTKTVDIASVKVRDPDISSIVGVVRGKPKAGYTKLFNLRPKPLRTDGTSPQPYEIAIQYKLPTDAEIDPVREVSVNDFLPPKKGVHHLHFYQQGGDAHLSYDDRDYRDADNQDTLPDPEDEQEGSTGQTLDDKNKSKYGLLIVVNTTKSVDLDLVRFAWSSDPSGHVDLEDADKLYSMAPGPKHRDQRSILLGPHDWKVEYTYTKDGLVYTAAGDDIKTVTVSTGREKKAYFYKNSSGGYGIVSEELWNPDKGLPNDLDNDDIADDEGVVDQGLNDTNKKVFGLVILKNMTRTADIDIATFRKSGASVEYPMEPGPARREQRSILLKPALWKANIEYTKDGEPAPQHTPERSVMVSQAGGTVYVYFYKTTGGSYDVTDTWPAADADTTEDDDEGLTDVGLNPDNKNKYAVLILKNLTKYMNIDSADFESKGRSPAVTYTMDPGPQKNNQRSIVLKPGDWDATIWYPASGGVLAHTLKTVSLPSAGREYYVYFYKTTSGDYDITQEWPPLRNDAADENTTPNDNLDVNEGILKVNNTTSNKVIHEVKWLGSDYSFQVLSGNSNTIVLPVGSGTMSFRTAGSSFFGLEFSTIIKSRQTTEINFNDGLMVDVPPSGGTLIYLVNQSLNNDTKIENVLIADTVNVSSARQIVASEFDPAGEVGPDGQAKIKLSNSETLPIVNGRSYKITVLVNTQYGYSIIESNYVLYNNTITITITDAKLEANRANNGKVRLVNQSDADVYSVMVLDPADGKNHQASTAQFDKDSGGDTTRAEILQGEAGEYTVYSTTSFNVVKNRPYRYRVYVTRGGGLAYFEKTPSPNGVLYTSVPQTVTLTVTQNDIDILDPPLPPGGGGSAYIPVQWVIGMPSQVLTGVTGVTFDGITYGILGPSNADALADGKPVTWSIVTSGTTAQGAAISGRTLTALGAGAIKVKVTVADGLRLGTPWISAEFPITAVDPPSGGYVPVTGISGVPSVIDAGADTVINVTVNPGNYSASAETITWTVNSGNSAGATVVSSSGNSGVTIRSKVPGTFTLTATLPKGISDTTAFTQSFPVTSKWSATPGRSKATVRVKYIDNKYDSSITEKGKWDVIYIEVVKRPASPPTGTQYIDDKGLAYHADGTSRITSDGNINTGKTGILWQPDTTPDPIYVGTTRFSGHAVPSNLPKYNVDYWSKDKLGRSNARDTGLDSHFVHFEDLYNSTSGSVYKPTAAENKNDPVRRHLSKPADTPVEFELPVKHGNDSSSSASTVYWVRLGMAYESYDAIGRWWKGNTLQEWFAVDMGRNLDKIDRNGVITLGITLYDLPYLRYVLPD